MYPNVSLFIDGAWCDGQGAPLPVLNPATGEPIGNVAHAIVADLERALSAAECGLDRWRHRSGFERSRILRRTASLLRERSEPSPGS